MNNDEKSNVSNSTNKDESSWWNKICSYFSVFRYKKIPTPKPVGFKVGINI